MSAIPFCVCTSTKYIDAFPLLLSGVEKDYIERCASPAMPELTLVEVDGSLLYRDKQGRIFTVEQFSESFKYYDVVARILQLMKRDGRRCAIFDNPIKYGGYPLVRAFLRMLRRDSHTGKLQIILSTSNEKIINNSECVVVSKSNVDT